jgi:hypothetical protein
MIGSFKGLRVMQQQKQKYVIPRFHNLALVVLSYGMFELTARQLTLIMLCGLVAVNLWPHLVGLPLVARVMVAGFPSLFILPFAWITVAGRPLESWLLTLLRYWMEPKVYTWQSSPLPAYRSTLRTSARKSNNEDNNDR